MECAWKSPQTPRKDIAGAVTPVGTTFGTPDVKTKAINSVHLPVLSVFGLVSGNKLTDDKHGKITHVAKLRWVYISRLVLMTKAKLD